MSSVLDFLSLPFTPAGELVRNNGVFIAHAPWAFARFGRLQIASGWWKLEFDADSDPARTEVRLTGMSGDFVVFRASQAPDVCVHMTGDAEWEADLLVSPWPGEVSFRALRLRRLSAAEEAAFLAKGAARMLSMRRSPAQIFKTVSRLLSGRAVGVRTAEVASAAPSASRGASNARAEMNISTSQGIEIHLLEGDQLHPDALAIVAHAFKTKPAVEAVYADAIEDGAITAKPDWDADLARHTDFAGAPVFFRHPQGDPAWPRLSALAERPGTTARIALPLVKRAGSALRPIPRPPAPVLSRTPGVSIIIPTKTRIDLLAKCFAGLAPATDYPALEVIVMDNGSEDPRLAEVIAAAPFPAARIIDAAPFNFSRLNNKGVEAAGGEIVLLLNDDIEPIEPGWLTRLVDAAMRPDAGAVGARLLYPNRTIQHAGVAMGLGGVCGHLWKGRAEEEAERIAHIACPGRRMAVTAACLAVRRDLYRSVGGLDETYAVALNDIDFCLRLHEKGLRNIYRGDAVLIHHESQSRGLDDMSPEKVRRLAKETARFLSRWSHMVRDDPFSSPAFDPSRQDGAVQPSLYWS